MTPPAPQREIVEQLAEEFVERYRRGERPPLSEYIARHPEHAEEIRDLFPALVMMERIAPASDGPLFSSLTSQPKHEPGEHPEQIGDYRILREIGRGGMGIVYEAVQLSLGRHVALKVLREKPLLDGKQQLRFEHEARSAARLHYMNIVPVFGVGVENGLHYYVMQYIHGLGLDTVLDELRRLRREKGPSGTAGPQRASRKDVSAESAARSLLTGMFERSNETPAAEISAKPSAITPGGATSSETAEPVSASSVTLPGQSSEGRTPQHSTYWHSVALIGVQVARALAYAHQNGVLHRDVKPANLLLDTQGTVWVTDFGLAKAEDQQDLTNTGDVVGTLRYLAPEMFNGQADARSEVYALGLTLYELLALRPAFDEADRHRLVRQVMSEEPVRLDSVDPAIPRDLVTIVHKAIDRDPACRYQTAKDVADDLQAFLDDAPIKARRLWLPERLFRWARRHKAVAAALTVIAGLLLAITVGSSMAAVRFRMAADNAEDARHHAEQAADAERWLRYRANIAAAASALQLQHFGPARRALDEAPTEYRDWEWHYLDSQMDGARSVVPLPKPGVEWLLTPNPVGNEFAADIASDHSVVVWDAKTGEKRALLGGHKAALVAIVYSRDGKQVATGGDDRSIRVWEPNTGKRLVQLDGHTDAVLNLAFSPDGRRLLSGSRDKTFRLWDVTTGKQLAVLGDYSGVFGLTPAFSTDGRWIFTGWENRLCRWDATTGEQLPDLGRHQHPIVRIIVSPNGKRVASQGMNEPFVVLWDLETRQKAAALEGHTTTSLLFTFSPDGLRLLSGADFPDNSVRLWDATNGQSIQVMTGHKNRVNMIAFNRDGTRAVSSSMDQTAWLWDAVTGKSIAPLRGHSGPLRRSFFSPDGKYVVTAATDQTLRLWDAANGAFISVLRGHTAGVWDAVFTAKGDLVSQDSDGTLRIWDLELATRNGILRGHESFAYDVAFSRDGSQVVSSAWDGTIRLWDATSGHEKALLRHQNKIVPAVALSADGKYLVSVTRDDKIHLWDATSRKEKHMFSQPTGSTDGDPRASFNPGGTLIAAGSRDGSVYLWDVVGEKAAGVLKGHKGLVRDVVFTRDGAQLASCGEDGTVRLWDVESQTAVKVLRGHTAKVHRVAFSADCRLLASSSFDNSVRLWDLQTYEQLAELDHGCEVFGVAFSPQGKRLATACRDNTVRLWDIASHQQVAELLGHTDYVHAVAFSPDGTRLVSASGDFTVRIWDTLSVQARAAAARNAAVVDRAQRAPGDSD